MAMETHPRCPPLFIRKRELTEVIGSLSVRSEKSKELPATTDGEWRRRHSLQSHKGGPETILFNVQGVF